jgi:hypothetical protein
LATDFESVFESRFQYAIQGLAGVKIRADHERAGRSAEGKRGEGVFRIGDPAVRRRNLLRVDVPKLTDQGEESVSSISQIRIRARLAKPPEYVLVKFPRYEREFFLGYANFILGLILSQEIREMLSILVSSEGIRSDRSIDLRVMIFPAKQLRQQPSRILYGSYSHSLAQISLYPLKISKDRIRREGTELFATHLNDLSIAQRKLIGEIATAAISTLIHEVLHVKFQQRSFARYVEEGMVQRLEKTYMRQWADKLDVVLKSQFQSSGSYVPETVGR